MARNPNPIHPRIKLEKAYEAALRRAVLNPLFADLRRGLAEAVAVTAVWRASEDAVEAAAVRGVPVEMVREALERVRDYHRARLMATFAAALGVDIRPVLLEPPIKAFMEERIADNVSLIKTIPPRMHESLQARLTEQLQDRPFDRKLLSDTLKAEYKSSGYNLRRLTRDQNNKMVGQLTEIRHRQLGIGSYEWVTAGDERVRPTHIANNGRIFRWDSPPVTTGPPGHEILCRCVGTPVVTDADKARLSSNSG